MHSKHVKQEHQIDDMLYLTEVLLFLPLLEE